jgi:hypothetical protein
VPEQPRRGSPDHGQPGREQPEHEEYAALCALAAGGLLEGAEFADFQAHMKECSACRADYQEMSSIVTHDLPQLEGTFRQKLGEMRAKPLPYSRQRFLRRARSEGVAFSNEVDALTRSGQWYVGSVAMLAPLAALVLVAISFAIYHFRVIPNTARANDSAQEVAALKRQNSELAASLSRLNESLAAGQSEIRNLRSQLATENSTGKEAQSQRDSERSASQTAQLVEESRNQENLLAEARDEAARSSQLRLDDEASMVEQQSRITELTNKLRIASATLDQERQLAAAGKDIRELMASRQLHVIDVRDTDPNGNSRPVFGRVFLTEGKSLSFYAFDLNEDGIAGANRSFQVWAAGTGNNSARSLGFLRVDAKAQGRWVLRVENPELVKEIGSVFVTVEPAAGGKEPSGQKMLYAYLGAANHP